MRRKNGVLIKSLTTRLCHHATDEFDLLSKLLVTKEKKLCEDVSSEVKQHAHDGAF